MTRPREVTITTSITLDVSVVCRVTPGEPATGPTYDCGGTPGSGPEVEIVSLKSDGGMDLTPLRDEVYVGVDVLDRAAIEALAIEAATEADAGAQDDAAEARGEF